MKKNTFRALFIGTDGSGKSSLVEACLKDIPNAECFYYGLKDYKTPFLDKVSSDGFIFRYVLFPIECIARNVSLRNKRMLLIDRMPGWIYTRSNLGSRMLRLFLPRVDILFLCDADEDIIFKRKPERSIESLRNDRKKWHDFYRIFPAPKKIIIDTAKNNVEQASAIAILEIGQYHEN